MPEKIYTEVLPTGFSFDMVFVEGGEFLMGSFRQDPSASEDERPRHVVRLFPFYIGRYPVTQELWGVVMEVNPSQFKGYKRPVERVSWEDAQQFIKKVNKKTMGGYRLPTEAEWEYASRGGKFTEGYKFAGSDKLQEVGWYIKNGGDETHDVGILYPNELGLYDMSGNVWEWCEDQWHDNYHGAPDGSLAWVDRGKRGKRVLRGGSWVNTAALCRTVSRYNYAPSSRYHNCGFRLAWSHHSSG